MSRRLRRHHMRRLKRKVRYYYGGDIGGRPWPSSVCSAIVSAGKDCSHPWCCGNPRRMKGRNNRTRKECVAELNHNEQVQEI